MKRQSKEIPANINSYTQASNQDKYNYKEWTHGSSMK
jgi:hypothetical protein